MITIEQALCAAGVQVTTLTTDHDACLIDAGTPASRIYVRKWASPYKFAPGALTKLARNIRDFDIVHVHALFSFVPVAAAWTALALGIPYVVRPLGTLGSYGLSARRRRLKRLSLALNEGLLLRRAAAIHYTSDAEQAEAEALGLNVPGIVIPLAAWIDTPETDRVPEMRHRVPAGRKIVLFLSRLDRKKNLEALIEAFSLSPALRNDAALMIAGGGSPDYVASLKAKAASLGVAGSIVWLGHVEGAQKANALAAADLFVLPSHSENFGIAVAEALLAGKPCVIGHGVAIADDVEKAGAGLAVAGEPAALARSIEILLADEDRRRAMGARARAFAMREYSPEAMASRLIDLYEGIRRDKGQLS